jgi:hypothetical protein
MESETEWKDDKHQALLEDEDAIAEVLRSNAACVAEDLATLVISDDEDVRKNALECIKEKINEELYLVVESEFKAMMAGDL